MAGQLDASTETGRDPASVRRIMNVIVPFTFSTSSRTLRGPVRQWEQELADLALTYGFGTFIFWVKGHNQLPWLAEEVAPAVRAHVAAECR